MSNVTQAMDHENCFSQYKSNCAQLVSQHHWTGGSKPNWNGVQIRMVQLVS